MRHLIKKQIIELTLDQGLNHFHVQQQVSERYWNEIVPMLEKAFDAISTEDELIEIDQFELDLGVVSVEEIEKESWGQEIRKKIQEKIAALTDPASSQYAIRTRDRRLGVFGQWLYYMDHGFLPWNTSKLDDRWYQDVLEAIAVDIHSHQSLQEKILEHPFFHQRVVSQHPGFFLHKLTEIITAKKQSGLPVAIDELLLLFRYLIKRKKITSDLTDSAFINRHWHWLLETAAGLKALSGGQTLTDAMTASFVKEYTVSFKIPDTLAEKIPFILAPLQYYTGELKSNKQKEKKKTDSIVEDLEDLKSAKKRQENETGKAEQQITRYNSRFVDGEGIFIVNAGTVLLHPFLKTFFNRLGFLSGGSFTSKQNQIISVGLIHYMATGRTRADEYELTLAKILCAYSLEEPLDLPETYPAEYLQEADDLLLATIAQWTILKNTTVEGLREGFLQRGGKLYSRGGNLYLQVEKKTIDVLLDYLPWNLGMIKLPWIRDVFRVEWR